MARPRHQINKYSLLLVLCQYKYSLFCHVLKPKFHGSLPMTLHNITHMHIAAAKGIDQLLLLIFSSSVTAIFNEVL